MLLHIGGKGDKTERRPVHWLEDSKQSKAKNAVNKETKEGHIRQDSVNVLSPSLCSQNPHLKLQTLARALRRSLRLRRSQFQALRDVALRTIWTSRYQRHLLSPCPQHHFPYVPFCPSPPFPFSVLPCSKP